MQTQHVAHDLPRSPADNRYHPLSISELLNRPKPRWICDSIVPETGFVVMYGAPSVGKSFVALDLALKIATSDTDSPRRWLGKPVIGGAVVYVAAEGLAGVSERVFSWISKYQSAEPNLKFIDAPLNLFNHDDVLNFIESIKSLSPRLIVIDTLARCTSGMDENSAKDMSLVVRSVEKIIQALNCCVVAIHHSGRAGWERGSTALRGAADVMLHFERHRDICLLAMNDGTSKFRDAAYSENLYFRLQNHENSCIVEVIDEPETLEHTRKLTSDQENILTYIRNTGDGVPFEKLLEHWQRINVSASKREPNKLRRVLTSLENRSLLYFDDESSLYHAH